MIGACSATSSSRKPSASTTPMTSGVFAASAVSRSWFSATEPPTSAPAGRSARRRSIVAPTALSDGSCLGTTWTMHVAAAAGHRRHDLRDAGVGLRDRGDARGVGLGRDDLQRAGRARAEGLLDLRVGDAGAVALGHDLDRRHAGLAGRAPGWPARPGRRRRRAPKATGRRHRRSPQAAKRGERCSPECTHGSESLSTRGPSLASTAGSSVSVAARMKTTESMIPSAIDRNAGDGTSITALQRDEHGHAAEQDGLAGGVHRLGDRVLGGRARCRRTRRGSA